MTCLFLLVLFNSCNKCEDIACSTGPPSFTVELLDAVTGANVFTTGKYQASSIRVTDELDQSVYTNFSSENNRNTLNIVVSSTEGNQRLTLALGNDLSIPIQVKVTKVSSGCCSNYFAEEIIVEDAESELVKETGIIKIKI
jgi:hypothetical protein